VFAVLYITILTFACCCLRVNEYFIWDAVGIAEVTHFLVNNFLVYPEMAPGASRPRMNHPKWQVGTRVVGMVHL